MPGTHDEIMGLVNGLLTDRISPCELDGAVWQDGTPITERDSLDVLALYLYARRLRKQKNVVGQRKAMQLLRSLLSAHQRQQLRRCRYFYVSTQSGITFRFLPHQGITERVRRHGSRLYSVSSFCLHDAEDDDQMPPADLIVAHLLMILVDESRFLTMANEHGIRQQLWNGDYLRRIRQRREAS